MQFGAHESIGGGLSSAVYRGQQATCDTIQLFNKSSNQWQAKELREEEVEPFLAAIDETGVTVACSHTSYLINIASPDPDLEARSCESLAEELARCDLLEIPHLVLHPGSHVGTGAAAGVERVARNLDRLFAAQPDNQVTLCLETTAGQGSHLGCTFEELAGIIDRIEAQERVGVCLDTCHLFAAGYPLADLEDYRRTMAQFAEIIGLERLKVIHLNDSQTPLGARRDRHEHIGKGEIGLEAFRHIVNDPRLKNIPMIIETPKGEDLAEDIENLRVLRSLVKKPGKKTAAKGKGKARSRKKAR
jgi:deoxyribonuclease-4